MDTIYEKLYDIKERYNIYIGGKSLIFLKAFMDGYIDREYELNPNFQSSFFHFGNFVISYYGGNHRSENWERIITAYTLNEEAAFEKFYEFLDDFLENESD